MASYNKVILLGNLTRDPQMSYLPSGSAVVEFGIATNRRWLGQDGQQHEEVCFTDCRMFGKRAEVVQRYFKKGGLIFVEGRLSYDSWTAQDGSKRSRLRVNVENFEFVGQSAAQGSQSPPQGRQPAGEYNQAGYNQQNNYNQGGQYGNAPEPPMPHGDIPPEMADDSFDPDDIPF